ncbi:MAG: winged helix-turn-helix domain-containing protein, partial [Acidobacteriota bacterium]
MYCFGPFRFDPATGFLRRGSDDVPLAPRAQALLSYLLERPGEVVAKDEVLDAVWGEVHVTDTSLKEAIHVLRVALGDTAKSATYIETIPRRGYRFLATVRREPDAETAAKPFTGNGEPTSSAGWQVGRWVGGLAIALMLASWLVVQFRRPVSEAGAVRQRFEVRLPPGHGVTPGPPNLALSPDGRHLAYVAKADGQRRLFLRPMARLEPSPIAGSEGATAPFFSPDGRWIGFFTPAGLHRVPRAGGEVETLCEIRNGLAASWGEGGIVMSLLDARDNTGLWSVPASGGRPRVLTTRREGEAAHRWPEVLPGGRMVLFTVWRSSFADAETALLDLESGEWSVLFAGSHARHAAPGHLVFLRDDQLWAAPFDERRRVLTGEAAPIVGGVATTPVFGTAHFAIASMGSLVFVPRIQVPTPVLRRLGSGPEDAKVEVDVPGVVHAMRLAPDGRRLAITAQREGELDLWIADLERGSVHRRT